MVVTIGIYDRLFARPRALLSANSRNSYFLANLSLKSDILALKPLKSAILPYFGIFMNIYPSYADCKLPYPRPVLKFSTKLCLPVSLRKL